MPAISKEGGAFMRRLEPIFGLEIPILFAHRGGVLEAPESTVTAFNHAIGNARADVLELDVQLTRDGQFVVWHGPGLSNVRIEGAQDRPAQRDRNKIYDFDWAELNGRAWVGGPEFKTMDEDDIDLSGVKKDPDNRLLLLGEFLNLYPQMPLNIEMKGSFKRKINDTDRKGLKHNVREFVQILEQGRKGRCIVVVSLSQSILAAFRDISRDGFPTGLSAWEHVLLLVTGMPMLHRALETNFDPALSNAQVVKRVARAGGSTFVFLTRLGSVFPPLDDQVPDDQAIFDILDRGVDGIMTDRPAALRKIMDRWIQRQA